MEKTIADFVSTGAESQTMSQDERLEVAMNFGFTNGTLGFLPDITELQRVIKQLEKNGKRCTLCKKLSNNIKEDGLCPHCRLDEGDKILEVD